MFADIDINSCLLEQCANCYEIEITCVTETPGWGDTVRWKLETSEGTYFFKEKVSYLDDLEFEYRLQFQDKLSYKGAPIPSLKRTSTSDLAFSFEGRKFELQDWQGGRSPSMNQADLLAFGQSLGHFHLLAALIDIDPTFLVDAYSNCP